MKAYSDILYKRTITAIRNCQFGLYVGRETIIDSKPYLPHGLHGIHISRFAHIGSDVTIFQNVTIGASHDDAPHIGNRVTIGANAVIIGNVQVGDNAKIGAGAIVVDDVPSGTTVVSQKARIINHDKGSYSAHDNSSNLLESK